MSISVKICGIDRIESIDAAIENGVAYIGFVFFKPSPRHLSIKHVARLVNRIPQNITRVALFVNPLNSEIESVLKVADFDLLQLHGSEKPSRVKEIKGFTKLPVMKAIKLSNQQDLKLSETYYDVADYLIFDAKVSASQKGGLPGGNAKAFDWKLLRNAKIPMPWMLAGGLNTNNVVEAVETTDASILDISSGVEKEPGIKNLNLINEFMKTVNSIK